MITITIMIMIMTLNGWAWKGWYPGRKDDP